MSATKTFAGYPVTETTSLRKSGIYEDAHDLYGLTNSDQNRDHLIRLSHIDGRVLCLSPAASHRGAARKKSIGRDVYERNLMPPTKTFWLPPNRLWRERLDQPETVLALLKNFDILLIKGGSDLVPLNEHAPETLEHKHQHTQVAPNAIHDQVELSLLETLSTMPPIEAPFGLLVCRGLQEEFRRVLGTEPEQVDARHAPVDEGPYATTHDITVVNRRLATQLGFPNIPTVNSYHSYGFHYTPQRAGLLKHAGWHVIAVSKLPAEKHPVIECAVKLASDEDGSMLVTGIAFQGHPERHYAKDGSLLRRWTLDQISTYLDRRTPEMHAETTMISSSSRPSSRREYK